MKAPTRADLDVDLDNIDTPTGGDTVRQTVSEDDRFSDDVFADRTSQYPRVDLDVGEALHADDHAPTNKQVINEMELSELEPVTMSEVGTKLDLARAYMDMGDPDGARSILEEVLQEGTSNQKQEAQRLLDSIR
jgi:pilus assembly protein FimV